MPELREEFVDVLSDCAQRYDAEIGDIHTVGLNSVAILTPTDPAQEMMVVKSPNDRTNAREVLAHEYLHKNLAARPYPGLQFPRVIEHGDDPEYAVLSYIPGEVFPRNEQHFVLNEDEQERLGREMARFMIWEAELDIDDFEELVEKDRGGSWQEWEDYFDEVLTLEGAKPMAAFSEMLKEMIELREQFYPDGIDNRATQVIHGDLRIPNLVFNGSPGNRRLAGIIDFEVMRLGDMAEELRGLYLVGKTAVAACNDELQEAGCAAVHPDNIKFWVGARNLGGLRSIVTTPYAGMRQAEECLLDLLFVFGQDGPAYGREYKPDSMTWHTLYSPAVDDVRLYRER